MRKLKRKSTSKNSTSNTDNTSNTDKEISFSSPSKPLKEKKSQKSQKSQKPRIKKIKRYKRQKCAFIDSDGKRCVRTAVGKGTLCKMHGGNPIVKENLIPMEIEHEQNALANKSKFRPGVHPIEFIDFSRQGLSDTEIASKFEVSVGTLRFWAEKFESFATAYEIGQAMHEAWWIEKGKDNLNSRTFNTPLFKFLTSNKLGYSDKMETKSTSLTVHGVLKVPDAVSEDEWESEI